MHVDFDTRGLTQFQELFVIALRSSNDFSGFVGINMTDQEYAAAGKRPPRPRNVLYYTKDERLHFDRIGQNRVLKRVTT